VTRLATIDSGTGRASGAAQRVTRPDIANLRRDCCREADFAMPMRRNKDDKCRTRTIFRGPRAVG